MKIKINWGTGIFIAIVLFMSFILSFFYRSFSPELRHDLVSEDYYKDELHYQEDIDKMNNALKLDQNIILDNSATGINIVFPENMDYNNITGNIVFQRLSNIKLDFNQNIDLKSNRLTIPDSLLVSGKWVIKIDWQYDGEKYLLKKNWFY